jgi:hypothetical protein
MVPVLPCCQGLNEYHHALYPDHSLEMGMRIRGGMTIMTMASNLSWQESICPKYLYGG